MVLQQQQRHLVRRGGERLDLLEDVEAVGLLLDQSLEPSRLSLDASQASSSGLTSGSSVPLLPSVVTT